MGGQLLIGTVVILGTVVFHVAGLVYLSGLLPRVAASTSDYSRNISNTCLLGTAVLFIIGLHTVEAWGWAALYFLMGEFTDLSTALYFSVVTSTTLGYGDLTLSERWQLLGSFEAMGGLMLFGASTAFLLATMRHLFTDSLDQES